MDPGEIDAPPDVAADPPPTRDEPPGSLGLLPDAPGVRHVEVAIDATGIAGTRTWTYAVPAALGDVVAGEAVLVDWGRRRALGIVLGDATPPDGVTPRPLAARVRADGPLLPPLSLALARGIADHYLAPSALVIRAMLPPGLLERLDMVATALTGPQAGDDAAAVALLDALAAGPRPVRALPVAEGRSATLRRLRSLERADRVHLEWTLGAAGALPRYERWAVATPAGLVVAAGGRAPEGRALGTRQRAVLEELAPAGDAGVAAAALAARHGSGGLASLARRGLVELRTQERVRDPLAARAAGRRGARPAGTDLSPAQAAAVALVAAAREGRDPTPILLDGPTGAGKTAVYAEAIAASLAAGRPALVLVPEIALALPLVDRLRADLGAEVAVVHSGLGEGERADAWRRVRAGAVDVVVGTRTAVLAPLADVGLVVVDEEHEATYKSDRTPRFQARDVAVRLAALAGAAVILGSATPSVESEGRARLGRHRRVTLPERVAGAPPVVELVDLRDELAAGNRGLLSVRLVTRLAALDRDAADRAILVINRRGSASAVVCRDCGHVQACPECTRPLVFHHAGMTLRCHHCGAAAPMASRCPACRSPRIRYLGGGTERLEAEVRDRFPGLRVARLDRDVVERRGAAERVVDAFSDGRLDVLVGTSLVTKGLDIPEVTLVGVVSADVALTLPDERAAERTYQLLTQAIGRAGRGDRAGHAIVQTYQPEHPAIRAVVTGDASAFYDAELAARERFGAPPFGATIKLTVGLEDPEAARTAGREMAERLRARARDRGIAAAVAGPAPAYVPRRAGRWRFNVVLRATEPRAVLDDDPGPPWSVDVDPESLL
ncbi:MAG: primosomal protein N' [Chloroflexi bacterium]|jgi:primosomal protein N' (replication factor Y)|nr:primosomal protein N' [Chloroflexota bacterium]